MGEMHDNIVQRAYRAIQAVFGDTSVSQEETLKSLRYLTDETELLIETIEGDLRRAEESG